MLLDPEPQADIFHGLLSFRKGKVGIGFKSNTKMVI